MYETVVPPLEESDFEKTVAPIVQEYFEHADANEVAVSICTLFTPFSAQRPSGIGSHWLALLRLWVESAHFGSFRPSLNPQQRAGVNGPLDQTSFDTDDVIV